MDNKTIHTKVVKPKEGDCVSSLHLFKMINFIRFTIYLKAAIWLKLYIII